MILAGAILRIADADVGNPAAKTLDLINTQGKLIAGKSLQLDAAGFSGDGDAISAKDLYLALSQDLINNGTVSANGNLTYVTTGNVTNNGQLLAGDKLTVAGGTVDNNANAEMTGTDGATVNATSTLNNRGLIDSAGTTRINAGAVNNLGTGRIYGDRVAIGAGTLNNDAETVNGTASAGTIAARGELDLGVGTLSNREHALIFSAGAMYIGGALDANGRATGQGSTLNNLSATVESLGDMSIGMGVINNVDTHIQVARVDYAPVPADPANPVTIIPTGLGVELPLSQVLLGAAREWATVYNGQMRMGHGWIFLNRTDTVHEDVLASPADPGRISASGNMAIDGMLHNRDGQVLAGGALSIAPGSVDNTPTQGQKIIEHGGTAILVPGVTGNNMVVTQLPVQQELHTIDLGAGRIEQFSLGATNGTPGAARVVSVNGQAVGTGGVNAGRNNSILEVPAAVGDVIPSNGSSASASNGGANSASGLGASGTSAVAGAAGTTSATSTTVTMVVRTSTPNTTIPSVSLFRTHPESSSRYLIETDPRFANYRSWLGSDYMLNALGLDPNNMLKRLGDGFHEQKLIREQVAQLTGYRYLDGYSNDQDEYTALMNAGVTFARQYGLKPGIALTAAQMAQLTSDIVWLVEQTVALPGGSTQRVLVPQVYVRVQPGDIDGSGSLLSADAMVIRGKGDLSNSGTLAGRTLVSINADNVDNLGGRIAGGDIGIHARNDLNNIGGSITAGNSAVLTAGRDINIKSTTQSASSMGANIANLDRVAGVYVSHPGGVLIASAGRDVNLIGAAMASAGSVAVGAGRDVNLGTLTESSSRAMLLAGGRHNAALVERQSRDIGSAILGTGNVRIAAGNDLNLKAGSIASAEGALVASAGHDIHLSAGQATQSLATGATGQTKKAFARSSTANFDANTTTAVVSGSLSDNTVALVAGNDIMTQAAVQVLCGAEGAAAGHHAAQPRAGADHRQAGHGGVFRLQPAAFVGPQPVAARPLADLCGLQHGGEPAARRAGTAARLCAFDQLRAARDRQRRVDRRQVGGAGMSSQGRPKGEFPLGGTVQSARVHQ